jgi:hypothetical protein
MSDKARTRLELLEQLFNAAGELPADARESFLRERCAGDAELLAEVRQLLELSAHEDSLLDSPPDPWLGASFERWRAVRRLGAGGMGVVYLAERDDGAFRQQAALKLLRHGLDRPELVERFREERQILAALAHASIARLIDGGATPEGLPWLVMEYVSGMRIDRWCDERRLGLRARLELFVHVCAAVHYAHQRLVVHRDIKPGNVLVTAEGLPKLVDFGISRVVEAVGAPDRARDGYLTPEYAAPEILRGEGVRTASDVFSLGVLLNELLCGERGGFQALATPSLQAAQARGLDPASLRRALRGDLQAIVARALEPEPDARYASVQDLADDVGRALAHRPVRARNPSAGYVLGRFVRRNRLLCAAGALAVLALAGASVASLRAAQAAREHARATQRANVLLSGMLVELDPVSARGLSNALQRQLGAAVRRLDEGLLADDPATELELRTTLGRTWLALGYGAPAAQQFARALELERRLHGPASLRAATLLRLRGSALRSAVRFEPAAESLEQALALLRGLRDDSRAVRHELVQSLHELGLALPTLGRSGEAEAALREALALRLELDGAENESAAALQNALAMALLLGGDAAGAEPLARAGLELRSRLHPADDPRRAYSDHTLASILLELGRASEALPLAEHGLSVRRALFDPQSPPLGWSYTLQGRVLAALDRPAEAAAAHAQALAIVRASAADDPRQLEAALLACGLARFDAGDVEGGLALLAEARPLADEGAQAAGPARARARELLERYSK